MKSPLAELGLSFALAVAVVVSGVLVVEAKHESRRLFVELQGLEREQDRLQIDWGRLQIEQSTWATHPRIESLAREQLALDVPGESEVKVVTEPGL